MRNMRELLVLGPTRVRTTLYRVATSTRHALSEDSVQKAFNEVTSIARPAALHKNLSTRRGVFDVTVDAEVEDARKRVQH